MEPSKLCAKDLMNKVVKTITEADSINKAVKIMSDAGVSSLVVDRNDDSDAFGIITRKDIVEALMSELETNGGSLRVEDIMSKPAIAVSPNLSIFRCYQMMRMMGVRRMPVVDDNQVVGILSNTDLFRCLAKDLC